MKTINEIREEIASIFKPLADDADYYNGCPEIYKKVDKFPCPDDCGEHNWHIGEK